MLNPPVPSSQLSNTAHFPFGDIIEQLLSMIIQGKPYFNSGFSVTMASNVATLANISGGNTGIGSKGSVLVVMIVGMDRTDADGIGVAVNTGTENISA